MSDFSFPANYRPAPHALENRVMLITGAGAGLGKALALRAAELGALVILLGRTIGKLEAVYDAIAAGGGSAAIYPLDLSGATAADYRQLAETLEREFAGLDAVVHCAASLGRLTPLLHYPAAAWQQTLQANLTGPVFLTQACLPLLQRGTHSAIIFTTDDKLRAYWGSYAIAKAAIVGSMKVLADELSNSCNPSGERIVSVNAVAPGPMRTQLRRMAYPGEDPQAIAPATRYINYYLYLLDKKTKKPNGAIIRTTP